LRLLILGIVSLQLSYNAACPKKCPLTDFRAATVLRLIDDVAEEFGIPKDLWYAWDQAGMPLTKVGPNVPISSAYADEELDPDRYQQLVRILDPDGKGSRPIVEVRHSLMCALSAQAWYALRVYVLLPPHKLHLRTRIRSHVLKHHADLPWT
jgi:hypothetical protein